MAHRNVVGFVTLALVVVAAAATTNCGGVASNATTMDADGDGWAAADDCDDTDPGIRPDTYERCDDAVDNDCDALVDDDDPDCAGEPDGTPDETPTASPTSTVPPTPTATPSGTADPTQTGSGCPSPTPT